MTDQFTCPICKGSLYLPLEGDIFKCEDCGRYIEEAERHVGMWE